MRAEDVTDTPDLALEASGCDQMHVVHKLHLLSPSRAYGHAREGNGTVAPNLEEPHCAGKPPPAGGLEAQIEAFVEHYNHQRHHVSLNTVTPADVDLGPDKAFLQQRPSRDIAAQYPVRLWKGSNERRFKRAACITASAPHYVTNQMSRTLA